MTVELADGLGSERLLSIVQDFLALLTIVEELGVAVVRVGIVIARLSAQVEFTSCSIIIGVGDVCLFQAAFRAGFEDRKLDIDWLDVRLLQEG